MRSVRLPAGEPPLRILLARAVQKVSTTRSRAIPPGAWRYIFMNTKRTVPTLLVLTSLLGLFITGCCWEPHRRHGRRLDGLDLKVGAPPAAQAEVAAP